MSEALKTSLSFEELADALRKAGYRASIAVQSGRPVIQSAAQGLGFVVAPGNVSSTDAQRFSDYSFNCLIRIEGELRAGLVERWNETKRFARLYRQRDLLVLVLDVIVVGGVSERFTVTQCELWDRLIHDFIAHLRQASIPTSAASPAASATVRQPAVAQPAAPAAPPPRPAPTVAAPASPSPAIPVAPVKRATA